MLKTGKMEIHQEVHIDDLDLIVQGDLLRKVGTNEEDSATSEELLLAGYVVDVPLSFKGSWIRVGIWNADDGIVEMVPVHVPFGSVLVRCNTLPHSGNYGSPGNTRFHAQLRIVRKDTRSDNKRLGYIRMMNTYMNDLVRSEDGWKVKWESTFQDEANRPVESSRWSKFASKRAGTATADLPTDTTDDELYHSCNRPCHG